MNIRMRRAIPQSSWNEIRMGYASGLGLREIARKMGIPAGTVCSRAKREGWSRQIATAKALAINPAHAPSLSPATAAALSMRERGERHVERMAGVTEKVLPHLESMGPDDILFRVDQVEKLDRIARRTFGITDGPVSVLSINVLNSIGSMVVT